MSENKKVPVHALIIYSVLFYGAWSVVHFFIEPVITAESSEVMSNFLVGGVIKKSDMDLTCTAVYMQI